MPTRLAKKVSRVVETRLDGPLVVTLAPEGVYVRQKGRRTVYGPIGYGKLYLDGARLYVAEVKRQKAEKRKVRALLREVTAP